MNSSTDSAQGCRGFRAMPRRQMLQAGVLGALGLSTADLFRLQASETSGKKLEPRAKSVIQINLPGGFPHHESFDPKPEAPVEYRGSFGVVKTKTGDVFSDNLPQLASISDKLTVVRSVVGKIPDHGQATYHLHTGYTPSTVIDYPQMGSVVSHELGQRGELPCYIAIPGKNASGGGTGFLPSSHGPFETGGDPAKEKKNFRVRDFSLPSNLTLEQLQRRRAVRQMVEQRIRSLEANPVLLDTMDEFHANAYSLLTSADAQGAFSFDGETDETFKLYGSEVTGDIKGPDGRLHPKGLAERLIIARRLVESGVRFVTLEYGSWDCHIGVEKTCLDYMRPFDYAISGLIQDLDRRGMLDSTIVWVTTEFGRTPKVNKESGRDHWARSYSMMVAGGGFNRGLVHGASDSTGGEPVRDAVTLENLMATVYHQLGIDPNKELVAFGNRPIEIIRDAEVVKQLIG
ncbi:MAG: DUF1501 domain-containing protein [Rubinisphaera brasiliensis]|uniref:Sulfatase n=1 Tax=Rubinisphaera brasiliensis (strain ATCC 49424 / DSM 5305 / JCM 21570 / IAM 15109 / NBRC 103401 / IFAM 1448) TaxID=756272 RepID=F0SHY0_RUBBR|nr:MULTISPECIES: DUF1501 domain-containing protein [Rubinisphaera]ADY60663.1 protein of unknown function DUF1501 [Rubinisphaera brasiliensis DSM 5305]